MFRGFQHHISSIPIIAAASVGSGALPTPQFNLLTAPSSGSTWTDASGNGRNATLVGSPTYISTNGGGIRLNNTTNSGGTNYISVPYNISSTAVTVEMVASWNPTSYWGSIWANEGYSAGTGYLAYMSGSSTNMNWGIPLGEVSSTITASNSIRHWVWVINGTSYTLYLNGSIVGSTQISTPAQTAFATGNFYFGARHTNGGTGTTDFLNNSSSSYYPVLYQMRVYNAAFSSANVTTSYTAVKNSVAGGYGLP